MTSRAYWLPHTSSVDFCEPNYLLTDAAVEPWNAASSLFISLFGVLGLLYSNPTQELRVTALYSLLVVIGLGSVALHTSLHWFAQSLDELPMLWFNVSVLYFLITMKTPLSTQPSNNLGDKTWNLNLQTRAAAALCIFALTVTYIYYNLQSLYGVFISGYIFSVASVFLWTSSLVFFSANPPEPANTVSNKEIEYVSPGLHYRLTTSSKACFYGVVVIFGGVGFSCWVVDMHLCESVLLPFYSDYTMGMTLHVIWHLAAAYGGYLQIQTLILLRARALGVQLHLHWQWPGRFHSQSGGELVLGCLCLPILREQKTLQKSNSTVSALSMTFESNEDSPGMLSNV